MSRSIIFLSLGFVLASAGAVPTHFPLSLMGAPTELAAESQASAFTQIKPFTINVPDSVLMDLKDRLVRARMPDEPEGVGWMLGTNRIYLRQLVDYWRDEFDWRDQERRLNRFEQFKATIDGIDIHFVHRRSGEPDAFPLILTHGWPGTFAEFAKVIGPLTDPVSHGGRAEDAFHVVIPSIPGYGFSDRPHQLGYRERTPAIFAELMARLGYEQYGAQGGDLGTGISRRLATDDVDHVAGLHLNLCSADPPDPSNPTAGVPPAEVALMRERETFWTDEERGLQPYSRHEATDSRLRPQRFSGWTGGVDRREVSELVRLRGESRDEIQQGRAPDDDHDLLGHPDGDVGGPVLLRGPTQGASPEHAADRGADGLRGVSEGVQVHATAVARGALQPQTFHYHAEWGSFCRQ